MRLNDIIPPNFSTSHLLERGVINSKEVWSTVVLLSKSLARYPEAQRWFRSQLYKHLMNVEEDGKVMGNISFLALNDWGYNYPNLPDWAREEAEKRELLQFNPKMNETIKKEIQAVIDWLAFTFENEKAPNPFRRGINWEEAVRKGLEWKSRAESLEKIKQGTNTVITYENGYRWVSLDNEYCVSLEGEAMRNCLRQEDAHDNYGIIYALRDDLNVSKINLGTDGLTGALADIQGRYGKDPSPAFGKYIIDLIDKMKIPYGSQGEVYHVVAPLGLIMDEETFQFHPLKDVSSPVMKSQDGVYTWVKVSDQIATTAQKYALVKNDFEEILLYLDVGFEESVGEIIAEIEPVSIAVVGNDDLYVAKDLLAELINKTEIKISKNVYDRTDLGDHGLDPSSKNVIS